jgi:CheY-like chemotaxis protein
MAETNGAGRLAGKRVMVVEDEAMIWMLIEDSLVDHGITAVGPLSRVDEALRAAEIETVDAALLDVNLVGVPVYPVADVLARRGIPYGFLTGYGEVGLREEYRRRPVLKKPFTQKSLIELVTTLVVPR